MTASCRFGSNRSPSAEIGRTPKRSSVPKRKRRVARTPSMSAAFSVVNGDWPSAASIVRCRLSTTTKISRAKSAIANLRASPAVRLACRRVFSASASARSKRSRSDAFSFNRLPTSTASVATASSSILGGLAMLVMPHAACTTLLLPLPSARGRAGTLLQLHGAARLSILDGRHSQISARVWGVCCGIDDLADRPHCIDDLCAGGIRHELGERLDLAGSISVRSQDEQVGLGRFETSDGSLQHLREPLVEQ